MRAHPIHVAFFLTFLAAPSMLPQAETRAAPPPAVPPATAAPPKARTVEVTDDYFGTKVADPYRWMEKGGEELTQWLRAQSAYTERQLAMLPGRERLIKRVHDLSLGTGRTTIDAMAGPYRFYSKIAPGEQLRKLVVSGPDGKQRVLVDPAALAGKAGHVSLNSSQPSFDGKLVACDLAEGGAEIGTIHVYESATGRELPDRIERVWGEFAVNWLPDGKSFFYTQMAPENSGADRMQGMRVFLHALGRPSSEDTLVLAPNKDSAFPIAPEEFPSVLVQPGTDWLIATAGGAHPETRIAVARRSELNGQKTPWRKVAEYSDGIEGFAVFGDDLVLLTRVQAPNRRLLAVPLDNPKIASARVLVAEEPDSSIQQFAVTRDALYIVDLVGGRARLRRLAAGAATTTVLKLPYEGWTPSLVTDPLQSDWYVPLATWTRPTRFFHWTAAGFEDTGVGDVSPADFGHVAVEEVEVPADDGEKVPLTILALRGIQRDGSHPAILTGYGGYGISILPFFDPTLLAWIERGGVVAVAHVRGGGEKGHRWYEAGKGKNKPRGIKDFQQCAEYLAKNGWTSASRLAASGGSMGGVLVGRAITERPELFRAAVIGVGMVNALRYLEGNNGANQTSELEATPSTPEGFRTLMAMDAYQNLKPGVSYPAVLLTIGLNDQRVSPWASAKFAARLQAASSGGRPALVRVEGDAGHGIGSTRDQQAATRSDAWSFVLWQTGDPEFQPKK